MDGLMVTGGPDVSAQYHPDAPARPELIEDAEPERDAWEFAALASAYSRGRSHLLHLQRHPGAEPVPRRVATSWIFRAIIFLK